MNVAIRTEAMNCVAYNIIGKSLMHNIMFTYNIIERHYYYYIADAYVCYVQ